MCSGKVRSSCSICGTRNVGLYDINQCLQVDIVQLLSILNLMCVTYALWARLTRACVCEHQSHILRF